MFFPDCGIGSPTDGTGPCTGTYAGQASEAGKGVFDHLSATSIVAAVIAAGVLIAAVFFAAWLAKKVGGFFGAAPVKGLTEQDDEFWRAAGDADRSSGAAASADKRAADNLAGSYSSRLIGSKSLRLS